MPYSLSGSGIHSVGAGVGALQVHVSTFGTGHSSGSANPINYYGLGLLRPSDGTAFFPPWPIDALDCWVPLPQTCTQFGYALLGGTVISVTEVVSANPFAGPAGPAGPTGASGAPGAAGTATKIGSVTASGGESSLSLSSITGTYSHLLIPWQARSNAASVTLVQLNAQLNGDIAANYENGVLGSGGNTNQISQSSGFFSRIPASASVANQAGSGVAFLPFYSNTSFHKKLLQQYTIDSSSSATGVGADAGMFSWRSTAAVTSIKFIPASGTFVAGSEFDLYGLA